jgi:predicted porin
MKKLLIATAALAMVAGTAQAQSSVSVYGIIDVNVQSNETEGVSGGADSTGTLRDGNALSTSRLGFRGTEDLGSGLKAEFQLESELTPQDGKFGASGAMTSLFNRESWVGLTDAKLGAIRIGVTDTSDAVNIDTTVSQIGELAKASELGTDKARSIRYTTPTFNGFSAQYGHSQPDATSTVENTANSVTSAVVKYEAGALGLYAGMESKKIDATYTQDQSMYGIKYNFGPVAVGAFYSVRDGALSTTQSSAELKQTRLSVSAPVAALGKVITAHAAYLKDETSTVATTDYTGYKLALTKDFSKRTTGYVGYISTDKEVSTQADSSSYVVGVRHSF